MFTGRGFPDASPHSHDVDFFLASQQKFVSRGARYLAPVRVFFSLLSALSIP